MATPEWAPFVSFITGWFNLIGNAAGDASDAYGCASMVAACVALDSTAATPLLSTHGEQVARSIGIAAAWGVNNCARIDHQGWCVRKPRARTHAL
jgi:hypothetical protein